MKYNAGSPETYIAQLPEARQPVVSKLRNIILQNLPDGFEESISYGMIGYVVPHRLYPKGYHRNPELPLPFMNIASQKNFVAVYSSALYANTSLLNWFTAEFPKFSKRKIDMGKSCIRFKNINDIPYELIGELASKYNVEEWIAIYEKTITT